MNLYGGVIDLPCQIIQILITIVIRDRLPHLFAAPRLGQLRPEGVSLLLQLTREALQALCLRRLQGQPGLISLSNNCQELFLSLQNNFLSEIDCVRRCGDKAAIDALALPELGPTPSLPEIGNSPRLFCPPLFMV